ncbi:MAG TPA: gamma-glutamyltransferase [Candidatus Anammoximicrobium sp.]|nr:gamma-glutamyltransferase [Candidatus Anammoximicrobium sp.]
MASAFRRKVFVALLALLILPINSRAADDFWKAAGTQAAVATGGAESADAAIAVLHSGGNALDAAVAAMLVLSVTAPRFVTDHLIGSFNQTPLQLGSLTASESCDAQAVAELEKLGHRVDRKAAPLGHPVMLVLGPESAKKSAAGAPAARRHAGVLTPRGVGYSRRVPRILRNERSGDHHWIPFRQQGTKNELQGTMESGLVGHRICARVVG